MGRLLNLCLVLAGTLFVGGVAVLEAARHDVHAPLTPYIEMWQLAEQGKSSSCTMSSSPLDSYYDGSTKTYWCELESRIPGHVTAYFEGDTLRHVVVFSLQPNHLFYGDLVGCWGAPDDVKFLSQRSLTQVLSAQWDSGIAASIFVPYGTPLSYLRTVTYLALEAAPPPCRSV
jgi:hypothetical protein